MNADFPRILTLLRKERGISQKEASARLGISQALLSHYEKGIRECGLEFLIKCADFYGVSCDYLLGRSPDRTGTRLTVDDIPEPTATGKENTFTGSIMPTLHKKLIANSLNILYDLLSKANCDSLTGEISAFLSAAVYRMFRVVYSAHPKNQAGLFTLPNTLAARYADATMQIAEANAEALAAGQPVREMLPLESYEPLAISTQSLGKEYPLFASSLLNLISNTEKSMPIKEKQ